MMSPTLNLVDHLLARGRRFQQIGRPHDALRVLTRLAAFRDLPAPVAEEAQFRLGELQLRRRKYPRARRHLAAALRHAPDNARYHYRLAAAFDLGRDADPARADEHYRRSLERDDTQTDCLCDGGKLALRLGQVEEGLRRLRRAAELAPDDPKVLAKVVEGLRLASRADEARSLLLAARFRHPRDARYRKLWDDFQFQHARRVQDEARRGLTSGRDDGPVLLPFVRPEGDGAPSPPGLAGKVIRRDGPASPAPHLTRPARLPDQRHAL
jgi:Flp pilus assembly protein TadD